jgi:hypothetical protein
MCATYTSHIYIIHTHPCTHITHIHNTYSLTPPHTYTTHTYNPTTTTHTPHSCWKHPILGHELAKDESVLINKVLLDYNHSNWLLCLWWLCMTKAELSSYCRFHMTCKARMFTIWLIIEKEFVIFASESVDWWNNPLTDKQP